MKKVIVSYLDMPQKEYRHAQTVMQELGITWVNQIPDSMSDDWKFYGCENIPGILPAYVTVHEMNKWDYERSGLTAQQEAE